MALVPGGPSAPQPNGLVDHPRPETFPFGPESLADILVSGLEAHPDRVALIDGERSWTWVELDVAVTEAASKLNQGQLVHWTQPNSAELVVELLATFRAGAIWIATPANSDSVVTGALAAGLSDHRPVRDRFGVALLTVTSGTTGRPKVVAHSEHSVLLPGLVSIDVEPPAPGERIGTPLDLRIANLAVLGPISAFLRGSTFVVMRRRYAMDLASDIDDYRITRLFAVPTLAFDLVESKGVTDEQLRGLDRVVLGGSGSDPNLLERFHQRFSVRPTLSYGLSEAPTGVVRESLDDPIGSGRGFPLPHIEVVIVDPATGEVVAAGAEGEICLRAATSGRWAGCWTGTLGYLNEPGRTAALFRNGLLHTGDRGSLDVDGALSVTGRLSNLIIRGGKNIDPVTIETAARDVDFVADAVAIGLPDDRLGQIVGVVLTVPASGLDGAGEQDAMELMLSFEERTGVPIDEIRVVDQLPRNAMGKIDRDALARMF